MLRSHSDPGLLLFDPEIERTLRRARQARRRAKLARLALDNIPFDWSDSDSNTQTTSSDTGTFNMGEKLTLKQIGGASTAFDNQPNRFPELNSNFELKSSLINLLLSSMDFEVICATTRRTGGDEDGVKAFSLPFSLDDRAKDWYHTLPAEVGAEEILPKNDIYDALWAMLDCESENEAEEIPGQWDFDSVLNN
ncbi:hypothetical protein PIB30_092040 [Stylosanthes scabra]|uniref:Uncharacterized protein n=1 Tax=Stylosanthes scabra TaxID=79078 RepID=A0ABU6RVM0_9FABA|nr:hypothetical protein [Stylosanthes scabra]